MSRRGSLFASASVVSATILIGTHAYACNANFYPCEPQGAAAVSRSPLSDLLASLFKPGAASASVPAPLAMTATEAAAPVHRVTRRKSARRKHAPTAADRAELAAAPPAPSPAAAIAALPPQALPWAPIGVPAHNIWPTATVSSGGREEQGAIDSVRIVSAEEINEIDLAAPTERVILAAVRPNAPDPSETTGSAEILSASPEPMTADTSLLERVLVTFGGAFGAASAMRIFIG